MLFFALLVIPAIVLQESDDDSATAIGQALDWIIWTAFVGEAILMLRVVPNRWAWVRDHPLEVAIIVLTPPFMPASLQALRAFRLLRLLRLLRLFLVVRRLLSTEGVRDAAVLAAATVLGGGAAYAAVEQGQDLSTWDGVWWAITTVTTVGYGDSYPETDGGRVIAIAVMLAGIGFVAILTAAAAQRFIHASAEAEQERQALQARLDEISERLGTIERRTSST